MKEIKYNQIICCSSEKSATTGMPGFGVRAKSNGITDEEAEEIYLKSGIRYALPVDKMVTAETLLQTPQLDTIYPHIYVYKQIQMSDGNYRCIIARVMYAGADYGFYAESESNNRVGSNYIAHILVFNETPPMNTVSELLLQKKFLPVNTLCKKNNTEFIRILIGESYDLPMGEICINQSALLSYSPLQCQLLIAMLQAYKNKLEKSEVCNIITKINSTIVEEIIVSMGAMPQQLTNNMFFNANMLEQSCVPEGMRLIITNEKEDVETLDDYHVVLNALGGQVDRKNINSNYIFDKITELSFIGDVNRINKIAELYILLCEKPEPNFEKACQLVTLATTDDILTLDDAVSLDIEMIDQLSFSDSEKDSIWDKINNVLLESFTYPCKLKEIKNALKIIDNIHRLSPNRLKNTNEFAKVLSHILFGTNENFNKTLDNNQNRISTILYLFEQEKIDLPSEDAFYKSLITTSDIDVWNTFLLYYYKDKRNIVEHMQVVVVKLMESNFKDLAKTFFPVSDFFDQWIHILNNYPQYTVFVNEDVTNKLRSMLKNAPQKVLDDILSINSEALHYLDMRQIVEDYTDAITNGGRIDFKTLYETRQRLSTLGIVSMRIDTILDILNEKELSNPTYNEIQIALTQDLKHSYILSLYKAWVKNGATIEELVTFVSNYSLNATSAAQLLDVIWYSSSKAKRNSLLIKLFDRIKFKGFKKNDIIGKLNDKDAQNLLYKENKFFKKLFRTVFGIRLLFVFFSGLSLFTSCEPPVKENSTEFITPYRAEYYGDSIGIQQVYITEYNARGTLLNRYGRCYNNKGELLYSTTYNNKGGMDSVVYVYNSVGKLTSIRENGIDNNDLVFNDKHQLHQYTKSLLQKNGDFIYETYNYIYNPDSTLKEEIVSNSNGEEIRHKEFFYVDGKLQLIKDIHNNSLQELNFNLENGTINSVYTYSYPKGRLQVVRNYNYEDVLVKDDTIFTQIIKLTNSKGRYQGRFEKALINNNQHNNSDSYNNLDDDESSRLANIASIEKPAESNNTILNYINNIKYRIDLNTAKTTSPTIWLLCIVLAITCVCAYLYFRMASERSLFLSFTGKRNALGMKKMWMFNPGPYTNVSLFLLILLCSFITSVIVLLAFGAATYAILWVIKILIIILIWIGWIALGLGVLSMFGDGEGKGYGCLTIIIGGIIVSFADNMRRFGENIVDWGFQFMKRVNVFDWGLSLFVDFWDVLLSVFATPMCVFIAISLTVIFLIILLTCTEWAIMKIYGISRPCPVCGSKRDKEYWVDRMHKHPVKLQPGIYGVFSHTEPMTKTKMPTLLLLGKSKLLRKCPDCGNFITSDIDKSYGTEKHIGVVGHRSSGKSYLTYTLLDRIMKRYGTSAYQIDVERDTKIESNVMRIKNSQGIQTDVRDSYRAIQLILQPKLRPLPYHLFFYDVAGEKFNHKSSASKTAMDFYRNVNQIVFIIDPTSIDFSHTSISDKMQGWLKTNASDEKYSIDGTFSTLKSILESVGHHSTDIYFMFVLVKADKSFLQHCGYNPKMSNDEIKRFMQYELGLTNIINAASGAFKKVEYEIASVRTEYDLQLNRIIDEVFNNLGI